MRRLRFFKRKHKKVQEVVSILESGKILPRKYKDHALRGNMNIYRELHIEPNLLLVYERDVVERMIILINIGSHSQIF